MVEKKALYDNVLVMVRQQEDFFRQISPNIFKGKVSYLNEYRAGKGINLMDRFYDAYRSGPVKNLKDKRESEIILRDRLLRVLDRDKALRMLRAAENALDRIFADIRPDFFMAKPVDSYIADIAYEKLTGMGVDVLGIGAHVFDNYSRFHLLGEHVQTRDVNDSEIPAVLNKIAAPDYRPKFAVYKQLSLKVHLDRLARLKVKRLLYTYKKLAEKDLLNYEYMSISSKIDKRNFMGYFYNKVTDRDWIDIIKKSSKPSIYIPLHCWPEITVDYWLSNLDFVDYENSTLKITELLSRNFNVLVKEHPWMAGGRELCYYQKLKDAGAILPPAFTHSSTMMEHSDYVLVANSTVGIEAALRGKRTVTLEKPSYFIPEAFLSVKDYSDIAELSPEIIEKKELPPLEELRMLLMRHILSGCFVGDFLKIDYMNKPNLERVAMSIAEYLTGPYYAGGVVK